ncbi:MAG: hypothetical protein GQF41_3198 [Candidatus Rifleibacterium amylolyticum]|nr:MAG: hypothetical protein GQF41_3198 [Candidatus Rifleibacterium amylolyticum]
MTKTNFAPLRENIGSATSPDGHAQNGPIPLNDKNVFASLRLGVSVRGIV